MHVRKLRLKFPDLLVVVIVLGDEFQAIAVPVAVADKGPEGDRLVGIGQHEFDRDLSTDMEVDVGGHRESPDADVCAVTFRGDDTSWALRGHSNLHGHVHCDSRPSSFCRELSRIDFLEVTLGPR